MLLRFRTKEGTFRVKCEPNDTIENVAFTLINDHLKKPVESIDLESIQIQSNGSQFFALKDIKDQTIATLSLKHGDMLTMNYKDSATAGASSSVSNSATSVQINNLNNNTRQRQKLPELPVDVSLKKQTGFIPRKKSNFCKHGDKGMCEYCSPLPPWDKDYQLEHGFKHLSFHAYLKSLEEQSASNKSKNLGASYIHPLSQPNYKINKKSSCQHDPWPKGICSKCQPSAITLKQQSFRMCDNVQFVDSGLINEFVDTWRQSGTQRFGVLYGTYEEYNGVEDSKNSAISKPTAQKIDETLPPLGIKALVQAIYEPMQHDEVDGLTYDVDNFKTEIEETNKMAAEFGIYPVGIIFTDLTDSGKGDGSVLCKRHKDSYFLSSLEVIMSSKFQLQYKNICNESEQGYFSSKFVTCCVTGNLNNEIDVNSYQVSIEAEALVEADMISGSTHPSLSWINETNDKRYVPDIFYMKTNEYNLAVKENAQPAFPIEYLLVSLSHGFTDSQQDTKLFKNVAGFPWKNRNHIGFKQDYFELKKYFGNDINNNFENLKNKLSNFHVLLYLKNCEILNQQEWELVKKVVYSENNENSYNDNADSILQLVSTPGWQTLVMILQESI